MAIRLYFDEDSMNHFLAIALRGQGVDVLTAFEAGLISVSDEEQLTFAAAQGRSIYSFNARDFYRPPSFSRAANRMLELSFVGNDNSPSASRCGAS